MPGCVLNSQSVGLCVVYREEPSRASEHTGAHGLGYLDRLANQKVKGGALIIATTVHH